MKFFVWLSTILVAISTQANEVILPEVEATADVSLADVAPADFPGDHQRIELQDHRYGSLLIENILERQAGIQVRHLGGKGQFVYPSIRGASGQQLQIIWDGIPLTNLNSSEGELPSIGFSVLKSIDIYRGIAPVELAPTAIGGTIHLVSKEHFDQSSSGEASLGTGSFSSHIGGVWQQWQDHSWQVFGALDWLQAENDFTHIQEINSYKNPNEPTKEKMKDKKKQGKERKKRKKENANFKFQLLLQFQFRLQLQLQFHLYFQIQHQTQLQFQLQFNLIQLTLSRINFT